jgi:putative tricarboxylic transport membrane protein
VRALAVTSTSRLAVLPDVPTFRELGYDLIWEMFRGVIMPPAVPADALRYMSDAFQKMCRGTRWQKDYVEPNILLPACQGPEEFGKTLETVNERYRRTLQELGVIK